MSLPRHAVCHEHGVYTVENISAAASDHQSSESKNGYYEESSGYPAAARDPRATFKPTMGRSSEKKSISKEGRSKVTTNPIKNRSEGRSISKQRRGNATTRRPAIRTRTGRFNKAPRHLVRQCDGLYVTMSPSPGTPKSLSKDGTKTRPLWTVNAARRHGSLDKAPPPAGYGTPKKNRSNDDAMLKENATPSSHNKQRRPIDRPRRSNATYTNLTETAQGDVVESTMVVVKPSLERPDDSRTQALDKKAQQVRGRPSNEINGDVVPIISMDDNNDETLIDAAAGSFPYMIVLPINGGFGIAPPPEVDLDVEEGLSFLDFDEELVFPWTDNTHTSSLDIPPIDATTLFVTAEDCGPSLENALKFCDETLLFAGVGELVN